MSRAARAAVLALILAGCGVKGDPLPVPEPKDAPASVEEDAPRDAAEAG